MYTKKYFNGIRILDKKYLFLYSEDDAMWLKMVGDDIEKFARNLD